MPAFVVPANRAFLRTFCPACHTVLDYMMSDLVEFSIPAGISGSARASSQHPHAADQGTELPYLQRNVPGASWMIRCSS